MWWSGEKVLVEKNRDPDFWDMLSSSFNEAYKSNSLSGLLRLDFPRVFILIKDYEIAYWASYEAFKNDIIELNFLDPADREGADIDEIVTDAWNFLALTEEEEDRLAEGRNDEDY
jgi:hypothetical protein